MASIKRFNVEQLRQTNGLLHTGFRQRNDESYLGTVGEYVDTQANKRYYTGLLRDKDPLNNKKYVLFDKLEINPFTNDVDFRTAEKADLEVKNLFASGNLAFQSTREIDPDGDYVINPLNLLPSFEISAVTKADIFTVINTTYANLGRNLQPADYFHLLFDNPNIQNHDYVLIKNQNNISENGIYKLFINSLTGYTYFKRINDENTALNTNSPTETVITAQDNYKLVRYGRDDPVYYKIQAYLINGTQLQIQFILYDGKHSSSYENGSWSMDGDLHVTGDLVVDKSVTINDKLTIGKSLCESIINLTSDVSFSIFNLNDIQACIYRCDSAIKNMTIILPEASISAGKNIKLIKVDNGIHDVIIQPSPGQYINGTNTPIILRGNSDHAKLTCDGYGWFTF